MIIFLFKCMCTKLIEVIANSVSNQKYFDTTQVSSTSGSSLVSCSIDYSTTDVVAHHYFEVFMSIPCAVCDFLKTMQFINEERKNILEIFKFFYEIERC